MNIIRFARVCALLVPCALIIAPEAQAFCGVIQESAQAKKPADAAHKAEKKAAKQVKKLKQQYGAKLALDKPSSACLGGAVAIDASGKQVVGPSSCTVTQSYCVNP